MSSPDEEQGWETCVHRIELEVSGSQEELGLLAKSLGGGARLRTARAPSRCAGGEPGPAAAAHLYFQIVEVGVPLERALLLLEEWLAKHARDLASTDGHKAIWLNVPFWSSGSQSISLDPSLLRLIGQAGCELVNQFMLAVSDEDLESILEHRREWRRSGPPPTTQPP